MINRRSLLLGFGAALAAPSIVRAGSIMKIARLREDVLGTLDDYEEGTWTPILSFGHLDTTVQYFPNAGRYTKIGNMIQFSAAVPMPVSGGLITGLPFNPHGVRSIMTQDEKSGAFIAVGTLNPA